MESPFGCKRTGSVQTRLQAQPYYMQNVAYSVDKLSHGTGLNGERTCTKRQVTRGGSAMCATMDGPAAMDETVKHHETQLCVQECFSVCSGLGWFANR